MKIVLSARPGTILDYGAGDGRVVAEFLESPQDRPGGPAKPKPPSQARQVKLPALPPLGRIELGQEKQVTHGLVVAFFASLPLQWQILLTTPLGVLRWFHVTGLALCLALSSRHYWRDGRMVLRRVGLLLAVFSLYSSCLLAFAWYHGASLAEPMQQILYAAVGLFIAVFFVHDRGWSAVRYVAPAALSTYSVTFWTSASEAGVDLVQTVRSALVNVDPNAIHFALFRATFGGTEAGGRANMRHEIYAALLVAAYVSLYANRRAPARGVRQIVIFGAVGMIFLLVALSLSRAVILAALMVPAVEGIRRLLYGRATAKQVALTSAFAILLPLAVVASVPQLLWNRFVTDTASYEGRSMATSAAIDGLVANPLVGTGQPAVSSHNFVLDAAVTGGIVTAAFALAVFGIISGVLVQMTLRYLRSPSSVPLPALGAAAVAVARMLTAGGGTLHLVGWVGLGFLLGVSIKRKAPQLLEGPTGETAAMTRRSALPAVSERPGSTPPKVHTG